MKKYPVNGAYARVRAFAASDDRGREGYLAIIALKGHKFRRQGPLGRYVADFVCHEAGWSWRMVANTIARHAAKPSEPSSAKRGYRILQFWNNQILANLDRIHHMIAAALAGTPPPNPPPSRGRALPPT
jgi:very-short-patch-repair endonuclease